MSSNSLKRGELLSRMLVLAVNSHNGQFDKAGVPYILHPLHVMGNLPNDDEELQCIALGHDLVEDCKVTYHKLMELDFTSRVIEGIRNVTKVPGETEEEYLAKVIAGGVDSISVKIEDLRHNSDITRLKGVTEKDVTRNVKYWNMYLKLKEALKEARHKAEVKARAPWPFPTKSSN